MNGLRTPTRSKAKNAARQGHFGRALVLGLPYLWLAMFFLAPFGLVLKVSLSRPALGQPPYLPVFDRLDPAALFAKLQDLSTDAYAALLGDSLYVEAYLTSLTLAAVATFVTLVIAYPLALALARADQRLRPALLGLVIAPFWTSALIRVYAWIMILKDEGFINHALISLGLIDAPLQIFATNWAVVIVIVYTYLPFMVLPLYAALEAQDKILAEAAADLGASGAAIFWRITFPLSLPGVLAGMLMVFIPAVGEFVIPDLLGGSDTLMIGPLLWNDFFANRDWPAAAAAAIVLLVLLAGPLALYEHLQARTDAGHP
jgi:putrescine transport system permease protein